MRFVGKRESSALNHGGFVISVVSDGLVAGGHFGELSGKQSAVGVGQLV